MALSLPESEVADALRRLDLRLPDMAGIEVIRRIEQQLPETEIIVETGYGFLKTAMQALDTGAPP